MPPFLKIIFSIFLILFVFNFFFDSDDEETNSDKVNSSSKNALKQVEAKLNTNNNPFTIVRSESTDKNTDIESVDKSISTMEVNNIDDEQSIIGFYDELAVAPEDETEQIFTNEEIGIEDPHATAPEVSVEILELDEIDSSILNSDNIESI